MGSYGQNAKPNFDQNISLFQPSNLSTALILEQKSYVFLSGLGGLSDRRGGVESRSDLPDLKSSKVDFKVDFLTKVE